MRTVLRITGIVIAASFAASGLALAASAPVTLRGSETIGPATSREPVVGTSAGGRVTAAWTQIGSTRSIVVRELRFGGWTAPMSVPGSKNAETASIAVSPNGNVLVAWQVEGSDSRTGSIGVSYRPRGGSFGTATYLGSRTGGDGNTGVALAVNDAGRGVVTWTHYDGSAQARSVQAAFAAKGRFGSTATVDGGTATSSASGPSVAIDASGRAIAIYAHDDPETSGSETIRQALAGTSGGFTTTDTLDTNTFSENDVDTNPRVAANADGRIVAGWGDQCENDCPELFLFRMGTGTTTTGITTVKDVSNPGNSVVPGTGAERKAGGISEVAIDEAGRATMVWDASLAGLATDYEYWAAHADASGAIGSSSSFATNTAAVAGELRVAAANGRIVATWTSAPEAGEDASVWMAQALHPGTGDATWSTPVRVSPSGVDSDQPRLALSRSGIAAVVYRRGGDRVAVNTNASRDRRRPALTVPANGTTLSSRTKRFGVRVACPANEARCSGTMTARMGRSVVGRGTYDLGTSQHRTATLTLTRAAYEQLVENGTTTVQLRFVTRDAAGNTRTVTRRIVLRHRAG